MANKATTTNILTIATYWDFYEAGKLKWLEAASPEKYEKLLRLYGDDTFTKLMKKVEKYC
jgi:hypothetical protein